MALGDAAAAKGMAVVPATAKVNTGDDEINRTRDYIAAEMDTRAAAVALKMDSSKIRVQQADPGAVSDGTVWISWV